MLLDSRPNTASSMTPVFPDPVGAASTCMPSSYMLRTPLLSQSLLGQHENTLAMGVPNCSSAHKHGKKPQIELC